MYYDLICIILFFRINISLAANSNCKVTVDISDGIRDGKNIIKGTATYTENDYFEIGGLTFGCVCNVVHCYRKCCLENETLNLTTKICVNSTSENIPFLRGGNLQNVINVPENKICNESKIRVLIAKDFQLNYGVLTWDDISFEMDDFCLAVDNGETFAVGCLSIDAPSVDRFISSLGMIISMPFLAVTFLVYLVLPEKNLHRKALMFYVLSLLLGYICLVSVQLHEGQVSNGICHLVGYCIIFFFLVSFFWMNVMCVDMWLAFSGVRGYNDKRNAERRRFIYYCIYAWGMPVLHIILVFILNTYGDKEAIYHPLLGEKKCFLEDGYPNLFYFYLPMGILTGINIILFILTAVRIQKVKKETSMLKHSDSKRHSYEDDKQKFNLYLKLLFAMGINWTMEIISWAFLWKLKEVPTSVWYLTDFANALYGVFIFFIFVFKRKIWKSLKKRYYVFIGKPHLAHTMTTSTQSTRTSHFSTTDSGVNNDYRLNEVRNYRGEDRALNVN